LQLIGGVVLNDIGPEIDPAGVARIAKYAGKLPVGPEGWETKGEAVTYFRSLFADTMPNIPDWDTYVDQLIVSRNNRFHLDYDSNVSLQKPGKSIFDGFFFLIFLNVLQIRAFRSCGDCLAV
jgi:hypothetical protein